MMEWKGGERVKCEVVHFVPYPIPPLSPSLGTRLLQKISCPFRAETSSAASIILPSYWRNTLLFLVSRARPLSRPRSCLPASKLVLLWPTSASSKCALSYGEQYGDFFFPQHDLRRSRRELSLSTLVAPLLLRPCCRRFFIFRSCTLRVFCTRFGLWRTGHRFSPVPFVSFLPAGRHFLGNFLWFLFCLRIILFLRVGAGRRMLCSCGTRVSGSMVVGTALWWLCAHHVCGGNRAGPAAVGGGSEVALKMIRNNDTMRKAAQKEVALLKELAEHDPLNKKHCIRLLCSLEHKQHVVMVFESMQMNLRETLKKFGRKTGINIHAVQKYGKQLLAALKHMASRNLVHADIKPDNILVDQGFGSLKLADFGSAFRITDPDNDPTPYLVSRWYRAPEIVMGLEYDKAIDLWSVAVTLFELYKGSPVLPGVNNNEMLKRMMEFKGPVPTRMVKSHMRAFETMGGIRPHFTEGGQFMQQEPDPVSGQTTVRLVTVTAPSRPIKSDIMRSKGAQDKKDTVADLADFLDKCMSLDPKQRISLGQCSAHSFLRRA
ncbi:unnamed protein product [Ectocarpus fasciculatus]